jgi:hypothetical protein
MSRTLTKIAPGGEKSLMILLISLGAFVGILEIDQIWDGPVYAAWGWIWSHVLIYKSVNMIIGGAVVYLVLRHRATRRASGIRESVLKHATLSLDLDTLEKEAKKNGVMLNLRDDPRIAKRNPPVELSSGTKESPKP